MARLLKSLLYGRNGAVPAFNINGDCTARLFCTNPPDESSSTATEQKVQEQHSTNVGPKEKPRFGPGAEYFTRREEALKKARPYSEIPEIKMLPIFGSSWKYFPIIGEYTSTKMYEADFKKQKLYGDIIRERFGDVEIVNCYHQDANEVVLRNEGKFPARAEFSTLKAYRQKRKEYTKLGLVVMQGEEWHNFRQDIGRTVYHIPKENRESLVDIASDFVKLIRAKRDSSYEIPDLMDLLYRWALESVSCIAIDARLNCLHPDIARMGRSGEDGIRMIKSVQTQLECINVLEPSSGNFPFWMYLPTTPTWFKFRRAADVFTDIVFKYVEVTSNRSHKKDEDSLSILERMVFGERMPLEDVAVAVSDIMMAGIDTTSHAAGYFLYNLAKNPDKQQLLYEELQKHFPGDTKTSHQKIEYFNWCMWESLRLLPVVRGNMRVLQRDGVLLGYRIPAGTAVLAVQQVFTRDERFYKNADKYIPERYEERMLVNRANPFGLGKRSCIGQRIATLEIFAIIVEVLRNFRIEYNHEDIKLVSRLVNIPDRPIRMRFYDR